MLKSSVFWDIIPCSLMKVNGHFRGTHYLHNQWASQEHSIKQAELCSTCCLFQACFLLGLCYDPEGGGGIFFRNFSWHSPDYTALYPKRQKSSYPPLYELWIQHKRACCQQKSYWLPPSKPAVRWMKQMNGKLKGRGEIIPHEQYKE
jgi:hypothetical protein